MATHPILSTLIIAGMALATAPACKRDGSKLQTTSESATAPGAAGPIKLGPVGEADMKGVKELRDEFLKVETKEGVEQFLVKLSTGFRQASPEVKLVAGPMLLLRPMRSIVYRLAKIVEPVKATHSALLTGVQQFAAASFRMIPTAQWQAVFNYVTEPYDTGTRQFVTMSELQGEALAQVVRLISEEILPEIEKLAITDADPVVWDNQFFYGGAAFKDQAHDRFVKIGAAEHHALIAWLHNQLATIRIAAAYDVDDLPAVSQALGILVGIDGFLKGVQGSPLALRSEEIKRFNCFGLLRGTPRHQETCKRPGERVDGGALVREALTAMEKAVKASRESYKAMMVRGQTPAGRADEYFAMRPDRFMADERTTRLALEEVEALVLSQGPARITSAVTSESVAVTLPAFMRAAPEDLKDFLPVDFVQEQTKPTTPPARNYLWGSPKAWQLANTYARLFPELQNGADVKTAARILMQSWGGALVGLPLQSFMD